MERDGPLKSSIQTLDSRSLYLRRLVVEALEGGGRGHVGPSMSLIEILRVLYDNFLRFRPREPLWHERDRLVLSKGHGCLALYAILVDKGFFPAETLRTFSHEQSILGGHPERDFVPGVEASTGALGHGFPIAVGIALAARIKGSGYRVVVVTGDGELNEGSMWEAALYAAKHRLTNLTVFVDYNKMQCYGDITTVVDLEPLADKWRSFGFEAVEVDGHDVSELERLVARLPLRAEKPTVVICHTVKGRGLPFAEGDPGWHYRFEFAPSDIAMMYDALDVGHGA
jgi:transketolase